MKYEELLNEADNSNVYVIENANFKSQADGLINGDVIGINKRVRSTKKRTCVLAEEMGHYNTTAGDILDQTSASNRKQERRARIWAYNKLVGLSGIVSAYRAGCRNTHEMAEHLEVTEDFLLEALACYRQKYGTHTCFDNYTVYFEPTIGVFEVI